MRPFEIFLLLANLLAFVVSAVPRLSAALWARITAFIALLAVGAQALVEGPRWQMIPAYALSGMLFLVSFLRGGRLPTKSVGAIVLSALGLGGSAILGIIFPVFRFPRPTGPYAIGTLTYHWVDTARPEVLTDDQDDRRELMVQIWYPAKADPSAPRAPYVPNLDTMTPTLARLYRLPAVTFGYLRYITTNAMPSASIADDQPNYPVLVFLPGLTGFRQHNTFQVEELVSHGYIVVGIDQPYVAGGVVFPDGRLVENVDVARFLPLFDQSVSPEEEAPRLNGRTFEEGIIPYLAQDVSFTLDQLATLNQADPNGILTGRLDLESAGIFGVSLGGTVVGEACRLERRLRACLVMDAPLTAAVVRAGLQQPTMWLSRDVETMEREGWSHAGARGIDTLQNGMRTVFQNLPTDGYLVLVRGTFHLNYTDIPILSPPLTSLIRNIGPINFERAHRIINAYTVAFFDRHLKGLPVPLLDSPAEQYPEVLYEMHHPIPT